MKKTPTIALVEDDRELSRALSEGLSKAGFRVIAAQNGEEGLSVVASEKPDIVLLDISMPKMDGIEMLRELRKREEGGGETPVLILTNVGDFDRMAEATELGVKGYLQKSEWHIDDIAKKILETLGASA